MTRARTRPFLLALLLLGAWLRWRGLWANTFHADEALFASWARLIAVGRDPLLQGQLVDKPPLLFYLQALCYPLMGTPAGWPARLPGLVVGLLLPALTGRLVWNLYRDHFAALLAVALVVLSPLAIQFSASAFIDPLMVALLVGALAAPRPVLSGLLFGLAILSKQQAWFFLPLLLGVGWVTGRSRAWWGRWLVGFLPLLALLLLWDGLRVGALTLGQWQNYGGVRPAWSWELWPRLLAWGRQAVYLVGAPLPALLLLPLLLVPAGQRLTNRHAALDRLFLLFLLAYLALHWLLAVPVWDRYLLPLLPLLAVLVGRGGSLLLWPFLARPRIMWSWQQPFAAVGLLLLLSLLLATGHRAQRGEYPVGSRPEADGGAAEVAALLREAPYGTVLYDHWWSWQWRFYFFDRGVYVHWFPHPAGLVEDLSIFGSTGERYLVLPRSAAARPVQRALYTAGFTLQPIHTAEGMTLFRIVLPETGAYLLLPPGGRHV